MLRTGSICASFLYTYITGDDDIDNSNSNNIDDIKFKKRKYKLKCLSEVFEKHGGMLSKLSQLINMDNGNFSNKVFDECVPYNKEKTTEFILKEIATNKNFIDNVIDFETNIYKSGSIGQVYKANLKNNDKIIIKVKYYGLQEQFETDINILYTVSKYFHGSDDITDVVDFVKLKLNEELDYKLEVVNFKLFQDIWKDNNNIKIVNIIEDLCTDSILTMKYIEGENLFDFINSSSQEEINYIGIKIIEFIFVSLFNHGLFYNDIHYGNFLIENKNILHVLDFGSINYIENELLHNLKLLYKSLYDEDKDMFFIVLEEIGVLNDSINTDEELEFMYKFFHTILEPILYKGEYTFTVEWYNIADTHYSYFEKWSIPPNLIYLNKIRVALFSLLVKMNVSGNFSDLITSIIE
jgi:ubiquinone biosynthesis protein